jgi:hypothetical protein
MEFEGLKSSPYTILNKEILAPPIHSGIWYLKLALKAVHGLNKLATVNSVW